MEKTKTVIINEKRVEYDDLRELYIKLFGEEGDIEDVDIETKSGFTSAILENVFIDLQEGKENYQKLRITAKWNPPQVVEVEPPPVKREARVVEVKPLKKM